VFSLSGRMSAKRALPRFCMGEIPLSESFSLLGPLTYSFFEVKLEFRANSFSFFNRWFEGKRFVVVPGDFRSAPLS